MLEGLRVIEIGQVLAAPYAAMTLADLGAEVIKIEKPEGGDDARRMGPAFHRGDALNFVEMNRGKLSVMLDLKTEQGLADLHDLIATADILIHNLRPDLPAQLGLDGATLCARYPRLIYCNISGFGDRGPLQFHGGFEPIAQAFSGVVSTSGAPGTPSSRVSASIIDMGTAMWVLIGALSALERRHRTGKGCQVNASLLETGLMWMGQFVTAYINQGRTPQRLGTANPTLVPYQAFATSDGEVMIAGGNDRLFGKLAQTLGHPEWAADPRFATNRDRITNRDAIIPLISAEILKDTKAHWFERLQKAGVPCAPVNTVPEALAEPQVAALDVLQKVPDTDAVVTGLPLRFDGVRPSIRSSSPELGEHTEIVMRRTQKIRETSAR